MNYCVQHNQKAYTEKAFEEVRICDMSGVYQNIGDGKIRIYCFIALYGEEAICPETNKEV